MIVIFLFLFYILNLKNVKEHLVLFLTNKYFLNSNLWKHIYYFVKVIFFLNIKQSPRNSVHCVHIFQFNSKTIAYVWDINWNAWSLMVRQIALRYSAIIDVSSVIIYITLPSVRVCIFYILTILITIKFI